MLVHVFFSMRTGKLQEGQRRVGCKKEMFPPPNSRYRFTFAVIYIKS